MGTADTSDHSMVPADCDLKATVNKKKHQEKSTSGQKQIGNQ